MQHSLSGSLPVDKMEGPYSARLPSSSIGEKSRRAPVGRETAGLRDLPPPRRPSPGSFVGPSQDRRLVPVSAAGLCFGATVTMADFDHIPVMLDEILDVFAPVDTGVLVDATLGGAGHASAILDAHPALRLVGLDQDPAALTAAAAALAAHRDRVELRHARFDHLAAELDALGITEISAVLFDLGVSSHQLDTGDRGFSFRNDGPLDMRMDTTSGRTAADLVNTAGMDELTDTLRTLGDERHARRIAAAIVAARPIETTGQLADVVADAMPAASRRSPGHPARRTFQALRIAVNDELGVLAPALQQAVQRLRPGGRGAVLSYHSGEDRIVKRTLRHAAGLDRTLPAGLPAPTGEEPIIRLLHRGGRTPTELEIERNPRAKAARLRSFEKTAGPGGGAQ